MFEEAKRIASTALFLANPVNLARVIVAVVAIAVIAEMHAGTVNAFGFREQRAGARERAGNEEGVSPIATPSLNLILLNFF